MDRLIPTLAMTRDPRLRKLFAHVGRVIHDDMEGAVAPDMTPLYDDLLDLAPEYLPPEFGPDEDGSLMAEWQEMVNEHG